MTRLRTGRRAYYKFFSQVYDAFVALHARRDAGDSQQFLMEMAGLEKKPAPRILDICCGTGAVIAAFIRQHPLSLAVGYDVSRGMLRKVQEKFPDRPIVLIEGAAALPFGDERFDIVTCSHALYELKDPARQAALEEMRRVAYPGDAIKVGWLKSAIFFTIWDVIKTSIWQPHMGRKICIFRISMLA